MTNDEIMFNMFKAVDEMPEEIQRFCVKMLIGEHDSINMEKKILPMFLKLVCIIKPENMNAIAKGVLSIK